MRSSARRARSSNVWSWLLPAVALTAIWFLCVMHLRRYDLLVFVRAGGDVLAGRDPFPVLGTPSVYAGDAFVYPWLSAFAFAPLSVLPHPVADIVYFILSGLAVVVGCRAAGLRDPVSVLLVLTAATTIRGFQVGSLNALLFLGCVLAWKYRDHVLRVAGVLTLVVGTKIFLAPILGWLVLSRRWRALGATLFGLFVVLGASFVLGPLSGPGYLSLLGSLARHEGVQGFSLYRVLEHDVGPSAGRVLTAVLALAVLLAVALVRRGTDPGSDLALYAASIVAALVLTPVLWSHYIVIALAPLVLARPPRGALALASAVSWAVAPVMLPQLVEIRTTSQGILLLYAGLLVLAVGLALRTRWPARRAGRP
ncbi:MAG: hypothetical protein JWN35_599 [Frankiales bacterium]|jgi:alpha-1,2-mannosyltransferase|nr:hypothetical protein [Frankiales bacterium]